MYKSYIPFLQHIFDECLYVQQKNLSITTQP